MSSSRLHAERLDLLPLDPGAAATLPDGRAVAAQLIGAELSPDWPAVDLLDVLPMQAATSPADARFGVWMIIERRTNAVIGDIGFFGPPGDDHTVEVGYSIVANRRRRGYATEAARALLGWALEQPGVSNVIAGCDPTNLPSIRTLERLGFVRVEQVGDRLHWRLQRAN